MGKKVKEYKSGDFIFAKVKGYPAWPARVQKHNGKKYFVYFYGTGETANLPPNMIFDYAENKDKFLTKNVKRRDFNDGVKQIEHDFVNNVPLEQVIGAMVQAPPEDMNDTANDTGNDTMDDSAIDTTAPDDTIADSTAGAHDATQNDTAVEDSDEAGALVIDEGKTPQKQPRKPKAPEPAKTPKTPKTPRGKAKKDDKKEEELEDRPEEKEEIVSRSGRKIRPKRYIDEQTEDNATLPSPAPKKRRGASPLPEKEKEKDAAKEKERDSKDKSQEKNIKHFNNVPQLELEDLKEPFKPVDAEKDNIMIAYLPAGQYVGIKLFQSRPAAFKDEAARLQWDKQAARNAITLKNQLERGQITAQSIITQLVMDLNLTDEEKASLDKERETEEKKSRVQFLKTEMKLIELDARIKSCLCLEKADTDLCLKLLDELMELDVKPLMLLKHPGCLETVKRMRAYVGNAPRWQLSEHDTASFAARAHHIRRQAEALYRQLKELFVVPEGLSFWELFSAKVQQFQKATVALSADQLLEMVHEPPELSQPDETTMQTAIDAANKEDPPLEEEEPVQKKKNNNSKPKKAANSSTPAKQPPKRQSSRSQKQLEQKEKEVEKIQDEQEADPEESQENDKEQNETKDAAATEDADSPEKEVESEAEKKNGPVAEEMETDANDKEGSDKTQDSDKTEQNNEENSLEKDDGKKPRESDKKEQEIDKKSQTADKKHESNKKSQKDEKKSQDGNKKSHDTDKKEKDSNKKAQASEKEKKQESSKKVQDNDKKSENNDMDKNSEVEKESNEQVKESRKEKKKDLEQEKPKEKEDEPRAKRSRADHKKTEPPPRSPAKRKSKA